MSQMLPPAFPTPIGVLREIQEPVYDAGVVEQIEHEVEARGPGQLEKLVYSGELWRVAEDGAVTRGAET
jgi:2-oxoglutarate ferredoxin oxidoreductase subunit beta